MTELAQENTPEITEEMQETDKVYTFVRPVQYEGQEYKEINLDFDRLTGEDVESCLRQYRADQKGSSSMYAPETDKAYQAFIVAKAAGVHVGLIRAANAKDYTRLTLRAQNFLLL